MATPREKWNRLKVLSDKPVPSVPAELQISGNSKTGMSFNVPITSTCNPTKNCLEYCYGMTGFISWPNSIGVQAKNLARLEWLESQNDSEFEAEADRMAAKIRKAGYNFLRFNGVGDLISASVKLINTLANRHPDIQIWVTTRKIKEAKRLTAASNVHISLSVDSTTPKDHWTSMRLFKKERKAQVYLAYTQRDANDVAPSDVELIFNEHVGGNRAEWSPDPRTCPATIDLKQGGAQHDNACENCRWCFDLTLRI